jgi:hypothetical protein
VTNETTNENVYYVYTYTDPRNDEIFYVGKGKNYRDTEHLRAVKNAWRCRRENVSKWTRIKNILNEGFEPIINRVKSDLLEHDAFILESELISNYKRIQEGGTLLNIFNGSILDDIARSSVSESLKKYYSTNDGTRLGKITSEETKLKQSLARKIFFANGGVIHNKKIWVTPHGEFHSRDSAASFTGLTIKQLNKRCESQCDLIITKQSAVQIKDFNALSFVGKTWRELGWFQKTI